MSIVRIGLAETKHFANGYDAIFAKKSGAVKPKAAPKKAAAKKVAPKAKPATKKPKKK